MGDIHRQFRWAAICAGAGAWRQAATTDSADGGTPGLGYEFAWCRPQSAVVNSDHTSTYAVDVIGTAQLSLDYQRSHLRCFGKITPGKRSLVLPRIDWLRVKCIRNEVRARPDFAGHCNARRTTSTRCSAGTDRQYVIAAVPDDGPPAAQNAWRGRRAKLAGLILQALRGNRPAVR